MNSAFWKLFLSKAFGWILFAHAAFSAVAQSAESPVKLGFRKVLVRDALVPLKDGDGTVTAYGISATAGATVLPDPRKVGPVIFVGEGGFYSLDALSVSVSESASGPPDFTGFLHIYVYAEDPGATITVPSPISMTTVPASTFALVEPPGAEFKGRNLNGEVFHLLNVAPDSIQFYVPSGGYIELLQSRENFSSNVQLVVAQADGGTRDYFIRKFSAALIKGFDARPVQFAVRLTKWEPVMPVAIRRKSAGVLALEWDVTDIENILSSGLIPSVEWTSDLRNWAALSGSISGGTIEIRSEGESGFARLSYKLR